MSFISVATSLFFVLNSMGNVPFFVGILSGYPVKRQRRIIIREMLIALFILICFNYFGNEILKVLGIDQCVVGIAGGTLLFLIALSMIFPKKNPLKVPNREPFIFPISDSSRCRPRSNHRSDDLFPTAEQFLVDVTADRSCLAPLGFHSFSFIKYQVILRSKGSDRLRKARRNGDLSDRCSNVHNRRDGPF